MSYEKLNKLIIAVGVVCLFIVGGAIWLMSVPSPVLEIDERLKVPAGQAGFEQVVSVSQSGVASVPVARVSDFLDEINKQPQKITSQKQAESGISNQPPQLSLQQQAENEFRRAEQMKQQGNIAEALIGLKNALKLDARHEHARLEIAGLLIHKKLNSEAEQLLIEGLQLNPGQCEFSMMLAGLQVQRNDLSTALETLKLTLPYADKQADYQSFVAALLQRQKHYDEAIGYYQKALHLKPNNGVWMVGLAISLRAENRGDEARNIFNDALDSNTLNAELRSFVVSQLKAL